MSKIRLTFKTPDVSYYALRDIHAPDKKAEAEDAIAKFVKYDEYINIEIDTETGAARVIEA